MKIYRVASTGTAHLTDAVDPICGSRVGAGTVTWGDVTCKKCLKWVESRAPRTVAPVAPVAVVAPVAPVAPVAVVDDVATILPETGTEVTADTARRVAFTVANTGERREGTVVATYAGGEYGRVALRVRDDQGVVWSPWESDTYPVPEVPAVYRVHGHADRDHHLVSRDGDTVTLHPLNGGLDWTYDIGEVYQVVLGIPAVGDLVTYTDDPADAGDPDAWARSGRVAEVRGRLLTLVSTRDESVRWIERYRERMTVIRDL